MITMMRALTASILIIVSIGSSPRAEAANKRNYVVGWIVEPDVLLSEEGQWVKPFSTIASAKLLPPKLFVTSDDVVADGSVIVPAGTKLIGLQSETMIACTLESPPSKGLAAAIFIGSDHYTCLIDGDGDGRFEQYFKLNGPPAGIPIGTGKVPSKTVAISPIAYTQGDAHSLINPPHVYVQYGWFASLVGELVFQTCLIKNNHATTGCLSPDAIVKNSRLPGTFEALGGTFRVDAKDENRVRVTQLTPFRRQPLIIY
ncbi:hypothetical protein QH494_25425 [Sphingomonas sp. AR_OL41]|uniref:hypothetical protein n=1 Tax=Sphingomonas sp. AR_OL41 TaxID=3042729 RepID=UPI00247FE595|nr:hypothetical protein [Sphingomonas sp. AR_OL41]MDH7975541.1 hypothetical protein [Sphingomonas sp. AR_OL41]